MPAPTERRARATLAIAGLAVLVIFLDTTVRSSPSPASAELPIA